MLAVGLIVGVLSFGGPALVESEVVSAGGSNPVAPAPVSEGVPGAAVLLGLGAVLAALAARSSGAGDRVPPAGLVVFVPGHGQDTADIAFADLADLMGLDPDSVRAFDHRWVTGQSDPKAASALSPVGPTAASLNAYLAGVGSTGDPVWLVGFSKGGTTVAELIAAWDRGAYRPPVEVRGAFLLDPPMARGPHGAAQSVGRVAGLIPDDGGYDPVQCTVLRFGCRDTRVDLGAASGVDVLVIRNPKSPVTNFMDHPRGLRVVDAPDLGPSLIGQLWRNPLRLPWRIAEAHNSVLRDPAVARCIVAEMRSPGTCTLTTRTPPPPRPRLLDDLLRLPSSAHV